MERRLFLHFPLVVASLMSKAQVSSKDRIKKGVRVAAGKDRYQEELLIMGGQFDCKVSAKDTEGDLCIYDTIRQEKGGPALHFHYSQEEWFYVITGEFIVKVGDDMFNLKLGDSALAPRKVPHAFAKINEGEGHMLVLFQPAGTIEDFFKQMSLFGSKIIPDQEHVLKDLWKTHGMEVVGPPLKY